MNTFYYAASTFECNGSCQYLTCPKRCLSALKTITALEGLVVLPGGSRLKTPLSMNLRSGDLVILYARGWGDLEELLLIREMFDTFKVVLILGDEDFGEYDKFHLLNPRYIATSWKRIGELDSVINRITRASRKEFCHQSGGINEIEDE